MNNISYNRILLFILFHINDNISLSFQRTLAKDKNIRQKCKNFQGNNWTCWRKKRIPRNYRYEFNLFRILILTLRNILLSFTKFI